MCSICVFILERKAIVYDVSEGDGHLLELILKKNIIKSSFCADSLTRC